jgi:YVTN family beta-propeller protein
MRTILKTVAAAAVTVSFGLAVAEPAKADGWTTIQSGYTAKVVAQNPGFLGGVAFAADGDILSDSCSFGGSALIRWDVQGATSTIGGSTIFTGRTAQPSNAGCGLTTHSNGSIYTNTGSGVVRLTDTGTQIGGGFGAAGNALGIAEDPLTGNLYYVTSNQTIAAVNAALTAVVNAAFANNGGFTDGIFWSPDGKYLFTTDRSSNTVDVFDRNGNLVVSVPIGREPDGIAFSKDGFVLTNNTDGTISKIVFNDLSNLAGGNTVSLFASGGSRGDLAFVGPDGCWYVTQDGTRFADGTTSSSDSIVKICANAGGGFEPPPGTAPEEPPVTGVPEPTAVALFGIGLAALGVVRRRKKA